MTTEEWQRLRKVTEAATPGPWSQGMAGDKLLPEVDNRFRFGMVVLDEAGTDDGDGGVSTAAFIATFDPTTVLALLDSLAALRAERLAAVALHQPHEYEHESGRIETYCDGCSTFSHRAFVNWPCPTIRALHPQDPDQERTNG
jgi:hypothetical protein